MTITSDEIIRMAREAGNGDEDWLILTKQLFKHFPKEMERFAALVAEAEGKRLVWACEQSRDPDKSLKWLDGFDACAAVLNAERIEI